MATRPLTATNGNWRGELGGLVMVGGFRKGVCVIVCAMEGYYCPNGQGSAGLPCMACMHSRIQVFRPCLLLPSSRCFSRSSLFLDDYCMQ